MKGSYHTNSTFQAIPSGVYQRLEKLTSKTDETRSLSIHQVYPDHAAALLQANLVSSENSFLPLINFGKKKNPNLQSTTKEQTLEMSTFALAIAIFGSNPLLL